MTDWSHLLLCSWAQTHLTLISLYIKHPDFPGSGELYKLPLCPRFGSKIPQSMVHLDLEATHPQAGGEAPILTNLFPWHCPSC